MGRAREGLDFWHKILFILILLVEGIKFLEGIKLSDICILRNWRLIMRFCSKIRGWVVCKSCDKSRAVFSRRKFKLHEKEQENQLFNYLNEIDFICGEEIIPSDDPGFLTFS